MSSSPIVIEDDLITVEIEPAVGGKVRSLRSRRTATEYLFQDARGELAHGGAYSRHDISGFDECFPTVGPGAYAEGPRRGVDLGDHGLLWQRPWQAEVVDGAVAMCCDVPELACRFERTCRLESAGSLRLDYLIANLGEEMLPYIYSAHPLLACGADSELLLPEEMREVFAFLATGVPGVESGWMSWPPAHETDLLPPYSTTPGSCFKAFSRRLSLGVAAVVHRERAERLELRFDTDELPYLGFLIQQGYDDHPDGDFVDQVLLALEPTTGIGDDLPTCGRTETIAELPGGETKSFTIWLTVLDDDG